MPYRRRAALSLAAATLMLASTPLVTPASADPIPPGPAPQTFVGLDGQVHTVSPVTIPGEDGYYYLGSDFDTACAFGGELKPALKNLSRLAAMLQRAGKRVLWTVSPNKSVVRTGQLPDPLPQGACASDGMAIQSDLLRRYRDPRYLPMVDRLRSAPDSFWRTDSHWNTVGTSLFALEVARALSPDLAARQHYRRTTRTHRGDLSYYVPGLGSETAPARVPSNGVRTKPVGKSPAFDPSLDAVYTELSWRSRPAKRTWPGQTLVLGDSFAYTSLDSLRNLFGRGHFIWTGTEPARYIAKAVRKADTVVFSVVQRFAPISPLADPAWQKLLRKELRR